MTRLPLKLVPAQCAICRVDDGLPVAVGEDFEYRTTAESFLMMRCRRCGLVYLNPRPAECEYRRIYPDNYHAFDFSAESFGIVHHVRRRLESHRLLRWCRGLPADARILDVGCGDGFHLGLLRDYGLPSWRLRGVEIDPRAANRARESGLNVYEGTIESMPHESPYDLALIIMTIEHLPSPLETLRAVTDHLRLGARLVIVTDNVRSLDFAIFRGRHWGGYHFPRHTYLFDRRTLVRLAEAAGLRVQSVTTRLNPVNWLYSFRNWIDDWGAPRWFVDCFSLKSPFSLACFTLADFPLSLTGHGATLQAVLVKPNSAN